jgi:hypothetical protein
MFAVLLLGTLAARADLDMIPADGTCLPGEEVMVFAPQPDTGEGWTCAWGADDRLGEAPEGAFGELTCPDCGGHVEDQIYGIYAACTDADGDVQWAFDDVTLRCSELEPEAEEPEPCGCGAGGAPSLAWLLVVPVLARRRPSPATSYGAGCSSSHASSSS